MSPLPLNNEMNFIRAHLSRLVDEKELSDINLPASPQTEQEALSELTRANLSEDSCPHITSP